MKSAILHRATIEGLRPVRRTIGPKRPNSLPSLAEALERMKSRLDQPKVLDDDHR